MSSAENMNWPFQLLVQELAVMGVYIPLEGHEPVVLEEEKLSAVRQRVSPDALDVLEKLVGAGAFGVHEPLDAAQIFNLKQEHTRRKLIAEKAEQEYQRLRAQEMARARVLEEKISRIQVGERLVPGGSIFDEPDNVPAIWGAGNFVLRAAGQGTMIASQQGLGKTTLAQQVVLHRLGLRAGGFLGYPVAPVQDGEAVLYLAMDRPTQAMGSFRRMMPAGLGEQEKEQMREKLSAGLLVWKGPLPFNAVLEPEAFAEWLEELGERHEKKIVDVVVDSVKDMAGGGNLSNPEVGGGLNLAWQEAMARGVDLMLLHHQRKAAGGESRTNTLDDVFGSTLLTSGLGSVFALAGESGGAVVELNHLKQPLEPVELVLNHDHQTGTTVVGGGEVGEMTVEAVLEGAGVGMTVDDLCQKVHGQCTASSKKAVQRALAAMAKLGTAKKVAGGMTGKGKAPDVWYFQGISGI